MIATELQLCIAHCRRIKCSLLGPVIVTVQDDFVTLQTLIGIFLATAWPDFIDAPAKNIVHLLYTARTVTN